jgi:hypothetical protein
MLLGPLVAITSRAALYPIQSIIIIALAVSGAYFHLLDIARNPVQSSASSGDLFTNPAGSLIPAESTVWARKSQGGWKWTVEPVKDMTLEVYSSSCTDQTFRPTFYVLPGARLE